MSRCSKIEVIGDKSIISFPFKGVAFGIKAKCIKAEYNHFLHEFELLVGKDYIAYLKLISIKSECILGQLIYYQCLDEIRIH